MALTVQGLDFRSLVDLSNARMTARPCAPVAPKTAMVRFESEDVVVDMVE